MQYYKVTFFTDAKKTKIYEEMEDLNFQEAHSYINSTVENTDIKLFYVTTNQ